MSQSSENQDNFELRPRTNADHTETSISEWMALLSVADQPATRETEKATATQEPNNAVDPVLVARADAAYKVNFDVMLGERSSLFDRVKLKSKTKPRKSMVPANFQPAAPLPITSIPATKVNSMLKRIIENIPTSTSNPSKKAKMATPKKKKKPSQVLASTPKKTK
ncbi:hypothetical protein LIER_04729 [Lithospermum erythrorhizon]|uniref:Uncharacterized protein n=1 Tax=Lithospermum erythrorhizon TaxID=34254 RepID=A0AAV3NY86_LITER